MPLVLTLCVGAVGDDGQITISCTDMGGEERASVTVDPGALVGAVKVSLSS